MSAPYRAELEFRLNQAAEYLLLRGLAPEDLAAMPDYDISAVQAIAAARAAREQELNYSSYCKATRRHAPTRRHRQCARTVLRTRPAVAQPARPGQPIRGLLLLQRKGLDHILLDAVPALAVRTSLVMQTNKNGTTRAWTRNEIYDIDALEAAVPYCNVVVTEKYACRVMNQSGLADRPSTKVVRRLDGLIPILQSLA